jgi:hypothetical protein
MKPHGKGYQAGPENFGYLPVPPLVAETEEKAQELGKGFVYGGGQNAFSRPEFTLPPGYNSKGAVKMLARQPGGSWLGVSPDKLRQAQAEEEDEMIDYNEVRRKLGGSFQKAQRNYQVICGTPKSVLPKIKSLLQARPAFSSSSGAGPSAIRTTHEMRLLANGSRFATATELDCPSHELNPAS